MKNNCVLRDQIQFLNLPYLIWKFLAIDVLRIRINKLMKISQCININEFDCYDQCAAQNLCPH